jgi:hypothetical protein
VKQDFTAPEAPGPQSPGNGSQRFLVHAGEQAATSQSFGGEIGLQHAYIVAITAVA